MTNDEIFKLANEAGFSTSQADYLFREMLITFARLIAKRQKERDAEICKAYDIQVGANYSWHCSEAILAQGEGK
jgi:hypothetical protein